MTSATRAPAVAGASVTAKNLGTQVTRTVTTGNNGEYTIPDLPVAHYSVTITSIGFKTYNISDVELQVAQVALVMAHDRVSFVAGVVSSGARTCRGPGFLAAR